MASDGGTTDRTEETKEGILAAIPESVGAVAARPAVTAVTQAYLVRVPPGDSLVDRDVRIGGVVRAALTAGLPDRGVAMGTMLGALRAAPAGGPAADIRGIAAAVLAATSYYGGRVHQAIDGILAAAMLDAEDRGDDGAAAVSEARRGIIEALEFDVPAAASFEG